MGDNAVRHDEGLVFVHLRYAVLLIAAALLLVHGCGGKGDGKLNDVAGSDLADGGTDNSELDVRLDQVPPAISGLAFEVNPSNVLSGLLSFSTDEPAVWVLELVDKESGVTTRVTPDMEPGLVHAIPVLGLVARHDYLLVATVSDSSGNSARSETVEFTSEALPSHLPRTRFLGSQPDRMSPGYTMLNVLSWADIQGSGLLLIVDAQGKVVWYHERTAPLVEALETPEGTILSIIGEYDGIIEIDMLGNLLRSYEPIDFGLDSLHHVVATNSQGNLLSLATELREINNYPTVSGGTISYSVVGEIAVEITRDRELVHAWPLLDILDPYNFNDGFWLPFWGPLYPQAEGGPKDWGHGNGIAEVKGRSWYLVSLANQDLIVCLDKETGKLIWKAGPTGDVQLEDGGEWYSYPHGAELTDDLRLLVYDDGTYKDNKRSRVVEYQIKEPAEEGGAWTAKELWAWNGDQIPFYSYSPADVDELTNGNLLVLHGSLVGQPDRPRFASGNTLSVRLQELVRQPTLTTVFSLELGGPWDPTDARLSSFGAVRIPGLYPDSWKVELVEPDCGLLCKDAQCGNPGTCDCGICGLGKVCLNLQCLTCSAACEGRVCGAIEMSCNCGDCPDGSKCDEVGQCQDAEVFCKPFCDGRECGLVGAIYMGQTCNCGDCGPDQTCNYELFICE